MGLSVSVSRVRRLRVPIQKSPKRSLCFLTSSLSRHNSFVDRRIIGRWASRSVIDLDGGGTDRCGFRPQDPRRRQKSFRRPSGLRTVRDYFAALNLLSQSGQYQGIHISQRAGIPELLNKSDAGLHKWLLALWIKVPRKMYFFCHLFF